MGLSDILQLSQEVSWHMICNAWFDSGDKIVLFMLVSYWKPAKLFKDNGRPWNVSKFLHFLVCSLKYTEQSK